VLRGWRRRRARRRVKPGDGSPLPRYRWWHVLYRSVFVTEHVHATDGPHEHVVDVDVFDVSNRATLYRDGRQHAVATMPAVFEVPGGAIEVAATMVGLKRVHLVLDDGEQRQLRPAHGTGEYWRARLTVRRPGLCRVLAVTAVVVLLLGLGLGVPQGLEQVSQIPLIAERFGTFTAAITLPSWANTTLFVATVLAAIERALTLRNHWLIDADTWWMG